MEKKYIYHALRGNFMRYFKNYIILIIIMTNLFGQNFGGNIGIIGHFPKGEFKENVFSRSNKKVKFFYLGSKNKWQNLLPKEIQKEANDLFENDLKFFNY